MTTTQVFKNTLVVIATLIGGFILLNSLRMLVVLLVAIILASALRPIIMRLLKWRVPEGLAIILVYALTAILILTLTLVVLPPVVNQFANYLQNEDLLASRILIAQFWVEQRLGSLTNSEISLVDPDELRATIRDVVEQIRINVPLVVNNISGTFGEAVLVFVMGVYWLTSRDRAVNFLTELFSVRHRDKVRNVILEIETSMGTYLLGMIMVASFVGTANFIILSLLRVNNAATLAFIIGVTTLLPVVGGFIGGGLSTLIAVLSSPLQGLLVFGTFVAVQQIETHYLTPRVMSRSVGLDPLLIIVAVFTGFVMLGVIGAVIAVPIISTIAILLQHLVFEPRRQSVNNYKVEQGAVLLSLEETEKQ